AGERAGLMAAHGRADAAHQQRSADHACGRRRRGAEEGRTAATGWRRRRWRLHGAAPISRRVAGRIALSRLGALPGRRILTRILTRILRSWRNTRHRAARLVAAEDAVAHRIEEAALLPSARRLAALLVLLDARIRGLERLVLQQHGLHQRIGGVRGAAP